MAFQDMSAEIRGCIPKLSITYARTLINRAWRVVRESNLWSFQLIESSWISPAVVTAGTASVTQGSATVTFDATAKAALVAASTSFSLITQRQFRVGAGGIYNLIAFNSGTGVATLDRIFGDPTSATAAYQVYQLYYPAPYQDFLTWISVRNPAMFLDLDLTQTRAQIDARDPQRTFYGFPTHVVSWGMDQRGSGTVNASATLNYPLYELWGQPVQLFTYQCYGIRRGVDLANPTDTLPPSLGEDLILAKAREYAYEWAEANKGPHPEMQESDFRFLMGKAKDEYKGLLTMYRRQDKEFVNNWLIQRNMNWASRMLGYYSTLSSTAAPYSP